MDHATIFCPCFCMPQEHRYMALGLCPEPAYKKQINYIPCVGTFHLSKSEANTKNLRHIWIHEFELPLTSENVYLDIFPIFVRRAGKRLFDNILCMI